MKLIAHRGWCAGAGENTLAAFGRAAGEPALAGVELDVRRTAAGRLVVSHDTPAPADDALDLPEALSFLGGTGLELFLELKEPGLANDVLDLLGAEGLSDRSVVFAFPAAAVSFPWDGRRRARLGVIVPYPWQVSGLVRRHRPDLLLMGWDERAWTRTAFRAWWSAFSLAALGRRSTAGVVAGVVQRARDLVWLRRQGVDAAVVDMDGTLARAAVRDVPAPQQSA